MTDRDVMGGWGESATSEVALGGRVEGRALMVTAAAGVGDVAIDAGARAEVRAKVGGVASKVGSGSDT